MLVWFLLLILGLAVLVKSSDWFTHAAERLGLRLGISPMVIGVTVVSIGTSLPELASSIVAVTSDASEIVIGNAFGSNIANVFLVLALGAIVGKGLAVKAGRHIDWPFLIVGTLMAIAMLADRRVTLGESLFLLAVYLLYLFMLVRHESTRTEKLDTGHPGLLIAILVFSGLFVYLGSRLTVESAVAIAAQSGISEGAIAASIIAIGTSIPELAVTVVAAWRGRREIAFGNILGSCIFNLLVVIGASGLFGIIVVAENVLVVSVVGLVLSTLVLLSASLSGRLSRRTGLALLVLYAVFLILLF
ncbi:sodium:calcium antiporter [Candidatus Woesearchaeota archaeon]|nr:MAG: sodium:calcium antiporter [Candidatus Woesearchaeota archaeon]